MMKKKSIRLLSVILAAGMVLTACSGSTEQTSSAAGGESSVASEAGSSAEESSGTEYEGYEKGEYTLPIVQEPVELTWMGRDCEEAGKSFMSNPSVVWEEVEKQTGIKIKWDVVPNAEYKQIMQVRLSSQSDLPDIICLQGESDGTFLMQYASDGIMMPLNDLINDYAPALVQLFEDYPDVKNSITLPDGQIVALPSEVTTSKYRVRVPKIRKDWLDKLGLPEVTTMDELLSAAKAFVENDPNGNGEADEMGIIAGGWQDYRQLGMGFGLSLVTGSGWSVQDGQVTYEFISEGYRDFLEWMHTAYEEGVIPKDFMTGTGDIQNERIASDVAGIRARDGLTSIFGDLEPEGSIQQNTPGAVWMPINFKDTEEYKVAIPQEAPAVIWRSYGLTKDCKDPVAAIRLFDYLLGEGRFVSSSGVEGVTYNMVNDRVVPISDWRDKVDSTYFLGDSYAPKISGDENNLGGLETEFMQANPETRDWCYNITTEIAERTYVPFQPPIPTLEDGKEISRIYGDLNTYRDEMFTKFVTGEQSLDTYDQYVEQMRALGCDTVRDLYQNAYDQLQ